MPAEGWHVTLAFLGDVPGARVAGLLSALGPVVAGTPALTLQLAGGGRFGSRLDGFFHRHRLLRQYQRALVAAGGEEQQRSRCQRNQDGVSMGDLHAPSIAIGG